MSAASYDELPYEDAAYFHTHPATLAAVATLCGFSPAPVETCRVLDLGCAAGFNLLAMSHSLPMAKLVGADFSTKQIERGRAMQGELGCKNVELIAGDIASLGHSLGEFDYILAHGVYSWVPEEVAASLLSACRRHLAPNGLVYISYNTLPGWYSRQPLRDLLRFHADSNLPPLERTRQARLQMQRTLDAMPEANASLRAEAEGIRDDPDAYVFHEYLEADNRPMLFETFMEHATSHELAFLAEARFATNSFVQTEPLRSAIDAAGPDLVRREQQHDFLRNRHFRQSILCRAEAPRSEWPSLEEFGRLSLRSNAGDTTFTSDGLLNAMLKALGEAWPRMITVAELTGRIGQPVAVIASHVVNGYIGGLWLLFGYEPPYETNPGANPVACPFARFEARRGSSVTNRLHRPVELNPEERAALLQADGTRPLDAAFAKRFAEEALLGIASG